jgi:hypothetical protein
MSAKRKADGIPLVLSTLPALKLFRMGWDTEQIAQAKGLSEATVYNSLDAARDNERRLAEIAL